MSIIADKVNCFISPIVSKLGYNVVEVEYAKKQNGMNLTVYIDSKNGITIEDCEKVHNAIDAPLDELDPTNGSAYILNVSSPGLDRPLKTDVDLENNLDKDIDVYLYSKVNGKKEYSGKFKSFNDSSIIIEDKKQDITFDRKNISKITKHISF